MFNVNETPSTQELMVALPKDSPDVLPYWYARVLGVFHVKVLHTGLAARNQSMQCMEFLWFGTVPGYKSGLKADHLPKIRFVPETNNMMFRFLDLSLIIQASHLIPAFADDRTNDLLASKRKAGCHPGETSDWATFYVSMYRF